MHAVLEHSLYGWLSSKRPWSFKGSNQVVEGDRRRGERGRINRTRSDSAPCPLPVVHLSLDSMRNRRETLSDDSRKIRCFSTKGSTVKLTLVLLAASLFFAATATAAGPSVGWSKKDITTAMRGLGYPRPHPKKLTCSSITGSEAYKCVATYAHHRRRRFVTGGVAQGGWLCAGKTLAACNTLRHGFVATDQLSGSTADAVHGAAVIASRGYMKIRYQMPSPNQSAPCTGSGATWTCSYYVTDTSTVAVTITLKTAKGGYVTAASTVP